MSIRIKTECVFCIDNCQHFYGKFAIILCSVYAGIVLYFRWPCEGPTARQFHTTCQRKGLMEFFDDKDNWGENAVKTGKFVQMSLSCVFIGPYLSMSLCVHSSEVHWSNLLAVFIIINL